MMGKVGFGCYRISIRSKEHKNALLTALKNNCSLIDTSANYTDGESEELIGSILSDNSSLNPKIVTKGGYIQGKNLSLLSRLQSEGKARSDLVDLGENLKHSIHPDFLKSQIEQSLERLKTKQIDTYLLHNPEYYFEQKDSNQEEYMRRIKLAFEYLEEEVKKGRIKNYGISSNNFILPSTSPNLTSLPNIIKTAFSVDLKNHFKVVQFPFNLIEVGALEKLGEYGNESLLECAQNFSLTTMINRPLNAFSENKLIRLATYDFMLNEFHEEKALAHFKECYKKIKEKWNESIEGDENLEQTDFDEIPLLKQFKEIWCNLPSPDAVEQVYFGYFFPFLAKIWGENGLDKSQSEPFYQLLEYSYLFSRKIMTQKARDFQNQASSVGLVPISGTHPFSVDVIETYLNYGFDYVLVGMKKEEYVNQLKHLF
jgi:aryl-alcohol dehydrogenase-like predicted oxidoreductase